MSALTDHIQQQQFLAVQAEAVAEALELMLGNDMAHHAVTHELSTCLVGIIKKIAANLDIAEGEA